jgi:hypothetical protein
MKLKLGAYGGWWCPQNLRTPQNLSCRRLRSFDFDFLKARSKDRSLRQLLQRFKSPTKSAHATKPVGARLAREER